MNTASHTEQHRVGVLLLNRRSELLLMHAYPLEKPHSPNNEAVWTPLGGTLEGCENMEEGARRQLFDIASLRPGDVNLGPEVWLEDICKITSEGLKIYKQRFFVGHTNRRDVRLDRLHEKRRSFILNLRWFSLSELRHSEEVFYPDGLAHHIAPIMRGYYPDRPLMIGSGSPYWSYC